MPTLSLRELFEAAADLAPAEREAYLQSHCSDPALRRQVLALLEADRDGASVEADPLRLASQIGEAPPRHFGLGSRIGPFELLQTLGEGGFSSVYRACRISAGVRQDVALKLLHRGLHRPEAQRQFRREREALARLQHPNIARMIEGGVTGEGVAYIALELVEGAPITRHASERGLDLAARLRLFVQVCRAVEAAHRALIVHRDLKPSNVFVTDDGQVKLLDFGIAKLLAGVDEAELTQLPAFTPAYAAPEQRRNDAVTTATDVYALGVLLGELLTGQRLGPSDGRTPSSRLADTGTGEAPDTAAIDLARIRRRLRGDLDRILDKALAPEPDERYASAGAFADDVQRHLAGLPVLAHPPSAAYRARKFVARHRGGVALALVTGVAILASLGLALWQANLARQEAARANTVRDFLLEVFDAARAFAPRDTRPTPEMLVEQARARLANTALDPRTRAEVLLTLGRVDLSLARHTAAEQAFAQAGELARRHEDARLARAARLLLGESLQRAGRNAEARARFEAELPALRAEGGSDLVHALGVLAAIEFGAGAPEAALAYQREAVAAAQARHGEDAIESLTARFRLGSALAEAQRHREVVTTLEPALERWRERHAPEDDRYVAALASLAGANDALGETAASEARLREVLALKRRIYAEPHPAIASSLRTIAVVIGRDGTRVAEAEALLQDALAMQRATLGEFHAEVAETLEARGLVLVSQRRIAEAQEAYREVLAICDRVALRSEVCPRSRNNLGMSLYRERRLDEAEAQMRIALAERRALYGEEHQTVAFSLVTLSAVAAARGDGAAAVELAREAMQIIERVGLAGSRDGTFARNALASALWKADRYDEALVEMDRVLEDWQRIVPDGQARLVPMLVQKAQILEGLGRLEDARLVAEQAIALGIPASSLQPLTRELLRRYSGRADVYPEPPPAASRAD